MLESLLASGVGNFASGLGKSLGGALGGDAGPFMGGSAEAMTYGTTLDGSGWVVNLGGQQIASASPTRTMTDYLPGGAGAAQASMLLPALLLGGAALLWFVRNRRR